MHLSRADRFYTLCVSFGPAENQRPSQAKLQPQPREAMSQGTTLVLAPALSERMRIEWVPPEAQKDCQSRPKREGGGGRILVLPIGPGRLLKGGRGYERKPPAIGFPPIYAGNGNMA